MTLQQGVFNPILNNQEITLFLSTSANRVYSRLKWTVDTPLEKPKALNIILYPRTAFFQEINNIFSGTYKSFWTQLENNHHANQRYFFHKPHSGHTGVCFPTTPGGHVLHWNKGQHISALVMKTHHVVSFSREMDCIHEGFSRVKVILSKRQTSPVDPHSVSGRFTSLSPYLALSPKFQGFNASLYR